MRPNLRFLDDQLITRIIDEARDVLRTLGVTILNKEVLSILGDHGAEVDLSAEHVKLNDEIIDKALKTSPSSFHLFDVLGNQTHDFSADNVHYTPGSAAINVLDHATGEARRPVTADYIRYAKLLGGLKHIAAQSTAFVPDDVAGPLSDSYRLFLSLLFCEKPVVTGAFTKDFDIISDLQLIVRGSAEELKQKPLTVISVCPTAPFKWTAAASQKPKAEMHPDVRDQVAGIKVDPTRPLVISDADEVIFAFLRGLESYLQRHDLYIQLESFALTGNIRDRQSDEVLSREDVREKIADFHATETGSLDPVDGVAAALESLAKRAQVLVLSSIPLAQHGARLGALRQHGMDYPLIANTGPKGPAVAALVQNMSAPAFFLDDIPHNIKSVAEFADQVTRIHFVADPRLARLIEKADHAHARIDDWPATRAFIEADLESKGY